MPDLLQLPWPAYAAAAVFIVSLGALGLRLFFQNRSRAGRSADAAAHNRPHPTPVDGFGDALAILRGDGDAPSHAVTAERRALVIGRWAPGCDILVRDAGGELRHARVELLHGANLTVEDLGSRSGTWLDGERIEQFKPQPLWPGATIGVHGARWRVEMRPPSREHEGR